MPRRKERHLFRPSSHCDQSPPTPPSAASSLPHSRTGSCSPSIQPSSWQKALLAGTRGLELHRLVSTVQAEHEGLDEGVAVAEGVGEGVGVSGSTSRCAAAVPGQVLPWPPPQHQGQVIPVSDDLGKSLKWPLHSPLPADSSPAPDSDGSLPRLRPGLPSTVLDLGPTEWGTKWHEQE